MLEREILDPKAFFEDLKMDKKLFTYKKIIFFNINNRTNHIFNEIVVRTNIFKIKSN